MVENSLEKAIVITKIITKNNSNAVYASCEGIFLSLGERGSFKAGKELKDKY